MRKLYVAVLNPEFYEPNRKTKKHVPDKEVEKFPGKNLDEMEESNLLGTEFKGMVIKLLKELRRRIQELSKKIVSIKKDIKTTKYRRTKMAAQISTSTRCLTQPH